MKKWTWKQLWMFALIGVITYLAVLGLTVAVITFIRAVS